jgi:hypothetical protein
MLGMSSLTGTPTMGQLAPGDPILNPNADPGLGPLTSGGPEPDQAGLEQLIRMLKTMGVGGAASGIPTEPGGTGLPTQAPPGGALSTGTPGSPGPMGPGPPPVGPGGGPPGAPTGGAMGINPLLRAMR